MPLTIQQAIDSIFSTVPGALFPGTVDTVKLGDPGQPLTGVAVTFLASIEVIEQVAQMSQRPCPAVGARGRAGPR